MRTDVFDKYQVKSSFVIIVAVGMLSFSAISVHASFWGDIVNGVKGIFSSPTSDNPTITSDISLVSGGTLHKNVTISSGDTVRFSYTISNPTKNSYQFSDFRTGVDSSFLNEINDVKGVASINDNNGTIDFPNFTLRASQVRKVSFDARVNLYKDKDILLITRPELVDKTVREVAKGDQKEVKAVKVTKDSFDRSTRGNK